MINRKRGNAEFSVTYCMDTDVNKEFPSGTTDTDNIESQPRTCPYCTTELIKGRVRSVGDVEVPKGNIVIREYAEFNENVWVCPDCKNIIR